MERNRATALAVVVLYGCATLQFVRYYTVSTPQYLNLSAYLAGKERLPFQERILPVLLMRPLIAVLRMLHLTPHAEGAFTPQRAPVYLVALVAMIVAGIFTQRLYTAATSSGALSAAVFPTFLFTILWTYSIHTEANFAYPYDLPAVAFFSMGLYFVYRRRFLPLALVVLFGTLNRETTLFLIGLYVLDQADTSPGANIARWSGNLRFSQVPWGRTALLVFIWLLVKIPLAYHFRNNSHAEDYLRPYENIGRLKPRLWPALLNVCGYMLPLLLLFHRKLCNQRFKSYLWILPLWFAVMFCSGVIVETRIYGELCPYVAVALVLVEEEQMRGPSLPERQEAHGLT